MAPARQRDQMSGRSDQKTMHRVPGRRLSQLRAEVTQL